MILSPDAPVMTSSMDSAPVLQICLNVKLVQFFYHVNPTQMNLISVKEVYAVKQGSGLLKVTSPECVIGFEGHPIFIIKVRELIFSGN